MRAIAPGACSDCPACNMSSIAVTSATSAAGEGRVWALASKPSIELGSGAVTCEITCTGTGSEAQPASAKATAAKSERQCVFKGSAMVCRNNAVVKVNR